MSAASRAPGTSAPASCARCSGRDVDFEAGVVHITKAYDEDSKSVKAPKTRNGARDVPIAAALVPLLKAMHERAGDVVGKDVVDAEAVSAQCVAESDGDASEDVGGCW